MIIAIDGTAASGKGTLGRTLAMKLGLDYLDTGILYRAVGQLVLRQKLDIDTSSEEELEAVAETLELDAGFDKKFDAELRTAEIAEAASKLAALPAIRRALLDKQRDFAHNPPGGKGAVLDGRDIGSVVVPEADAKFYVDAAADIRATRRHLELTASGETLAYSEVLADLIKRDCRDKNRTVAPLIAAEDAFFIDSSHMNAQEVLTLALDHLAGGIPPKGNGADKPATMAL